MRPSSGCRVCHGVASSELPVCANLWNVVQRHLTATTFRGGPVGEVFWSPNERGQPYYFRNSETGETTGDEPNEEFWLWDYKAWTCHVSGL
jgi:hypothetical protein